MSNINVIVLIKNVKTATVRIIMNIADIVFLLDLSTSFSFSKPLHKSMLSSPLNAQKSSKSQCKKVTELSLSLGATGLVCWSIIADILLIYRVYLHDDVKFFYIGASFMGFGTCCLWIIGVSMVLTNHEVTDIPKCFKAILCIPLINIPLILFYDQEKYTKIKFNGTLSALFQSLISFPLYIINVSFMLEKRQLFIWNILQLISSLFTLSMAPGLFAWTLSAPRHEEELSIKERFQSCLSFSAYIIPLVPIEIIHFFPLLFEYYYYKNLNYNEFVNILLLFNIPKVLILTVFNMDYGTHMLCLLVQSCGLLVVPTLTLPLLPWQWSILYNFEGRRDKSNIFPERDWYAPWNLVTMVIYFVVAYGGMTYYLLSKGVGDITYYLIIALSVNITIQSFVLWILVH